MINSNGGRARLVVALILAVAAGVVRARGHAEDLTGVYEEGSAILTVLEGTLESLVLYQASSGSGANVSSCECIFQARRSGPGWALSSPEGGTATLKDDRGQLTVAGLEACCGSARWFPYAFPRGRRRDLGGCTVTADRAFFYDRERNTALKLYVVRGDKVASVDWLPSRRYRPARFTGKRVVAGWLRRSDLSCDDDELDRKHP